MRVETMSVSHERRSWHEGMQIINGYEKLLTQRSLACMSPCRLFLWTFRHTR